jgi:glycine/D-amino acid oxidase-like deaminating enzyme
MAATGLDKNMPFYTVDLPYLWGRPLEDGRIVFGSGLAFHSTGDLGCIDIRAGDAAVALDKLEKRVRNLHPVLRRIRVETRWGGPIAFLVGRPPLLGSHPAAAQLIVAGGYTGHGVALSLRVGELAARAVAKQNALPAWGKL